MKNKSLFKSVALAGVLAGAAFGAHATVYPLGALSAGGAPTSFSGSVAPGAFADTFTFELPNNGGSGYNIVNFPVIVPAIPLASFPGGNFNLSFTGFQLYSYGVDGFINTADDVNLGGFLNIGPNPPVVNSYSVAVGSSSGGKFYFDVYGKANGSLGGLYNGSISVAAAPVPEPESYAMLLAGLGVMGAIAVRRNKRKQD